MKPTNNKSMFATYANIVQECDDDSKTAANRELKIKALKGMNDSLMYELKRFKVQVDAGKTDVNLREIELTNPEA